MLTGLPASLPLRAEVVAAEHHTLAPSVSLSPQIFQKGLTGILNGELPPEFRDAPAKPAIDAYGTRYEKRSWFRGLLSKRGNKAVIELVEQAKVKGYLTEKEAYVLNYAAVHNAVSPKQLDEVLGATEKFSSPDAVMRILVGRCENSKGTPGAYQLILDQLTTMPHERTRELKSYLVQHYRDIITSDPIRFGRACKTGNIALYWDHVLQISLRENGVWETVEALLAHPDMPITEIAQMGEKKLHRKTIEKRIRKANSIIQEYLRQKNNWDTSRTVLLLDNSPRVFELLVDAYIPLTSHWDVIEDAIEALGPLKLHIDVSNLAWERVKAMIVLRFIQPKDWSYKKLSKKFEVTETPVNHFFEGREPYQRLVPGALEKFRAFVKHKEKPAPIRIDTAVLADNEDAGALFQTEARIYNWLMNDGQKPVSQSLPVATREQLARRGRMNEIAKALEKRDAMRVLRELLAQEILTEADIMGFAFTEDAKNRTFAGKSFLAEAIHQRLFAKSLVGHHSFLPYLEATALSADDLLLINNKEIEKIKRMGGEEKRRKLGGLSNKFRLEQPVFAHARNNAGVAAIASGLLSALEELGIRRYLFIKRSEEVSDDQRLIPGREWKFWTEAIARQCKSVGITMRELDESRFADKRLFPEKYGWRMKVKWVEEFWVGRMALVLGTTPRALHQDMLKFAAKANKLKSVRPAAHFQAEIGTDLSI